MPDRAWTVINSGRQSTDKIDANSIGPVQVKELRKIRQADETLGRPRSEAVS